MALMLFNGQPGGSPPSPASRACGFEMIEMGSTLDRSKSHAQGGNFCPKKSNQGKFSCCKHIDSDCTLRFYLGYTQQSSLAMDTRKSADDGFQGKTLD